MNILFYIPVLVAFVLVIFLFHRAVKKRNILIWQQKLEVLDLQTKIENLEKQLINIQANDDSWASKLATKHSDLVNFALNIVQKNTFLEEIKLKVNEVKNITSEEKVLKKLNEISLEINQHIAIDKNRKDFIVQLEEVHRDFYDKLLNRYPDLTDKEKRLCIYLRLNLSSKEIASLLNITEKSVEINRYRLRKKLKVGAGESLADFFNLI